MKTETRELLGFNVPVVGVCETLAELVAACGSEEAVVKDGNNQTLAHSHFTILRRAIVKKLVELTGFKQKIYDGNTDEELTTEAAVKAAKTTRLEKDAAYIGRIEEELGGVKDGVSSLKKFEDEVAAVCAAIKVDYTPGTRGAGGASTPAKKWLAIYDQLVTESKLDTFCQKYGIDQSTDEETLKIAVANKAKEITIAIQERAMREAMA